MYCPECGKKITDEDSVFCPECGTRLPIEEFHSSVSNDVHHCPEQQEPVLRQYTQGDQVMHTSVRQDLQNKDVDRKFGILMTNIVSLAQQLNCNQSDLLSLLKEYIARKADYGIFYKLVDVNNYTFHKQNFWGTNKTAHLNVKSKLPEYMEILNDVHQFEIKSKSPESEYLFIVGGDNVIPMPLVKHFVSDISDKNIDTDILYAYPYVDDMVRKLETSELFNYDQLFYIGRLPVEKDTSFGDLADYLSRSVQYSLGIPLNQAYGQCDPHWKQISSVVSDYLLASNTLPDLEGKLIDGAYSNGLILSPLVIKDNVEQVFNKNVSFYYFNVHGSDALEASDYFGQLYPGGEYYPVFSVNQIQECTNPNVMVCEACYGARFVQMDKSHSMLLSALYNQTLAFIGSSRVAWGAVDPSENATNGDLKLSFADIIAQTVIHSLFEGYTVGEAFWKARKALFEHPNGGHPVTFASVVEFNLFGDPTTCMDWNFEGKKVKKEILSKGLAPKNGFFPCKVENIMSKEFGPDDSLLDQVRQAVDRNIFAIHSIVAEQLYKRYKLSPRPVTSIQKLTYQDGRKELVFNYDDKPCKDLSVRFMVNTSLQGEILRVVTTK